MLGEGLWAQHIAPSLMPMWALAKARLGAGKGRGQASYTRAPVGQLRVGQQRPSRVPRGTVGSWAGGRQNLRVPRLSVGWAPLS